MAEINLLNIKPNKISRNLTDYVWGIYGEPGIGKTTLASKFDPDKTLIVAFEKGYLALSGVIAVDVTNWKDFKTVIKQLKEPEVKEKFKFIFVDTADIAYQECERYICRNAGVEKIGDIPYGAGYKQTDDEFFGALKTIINEGYGLGWISHSNLKNVKYEGSEEYQKVTTTLPDRAKKILFGISDIVLYGKIVRDETGEEEKRIAYVRSNSKHEAKSRFKYMKESFDWDFEELVKAFNEAIDLEEKNGGQTVAKYDKPRYELNEEDELFELISQIKDLVRSKRDAGIDTKIIKEALENTNPDKLTDIESAKRILSALKQL